MAVGRPIITGDTPGSREEVVANAVMALDLPENAWARV